MLPTERDIEFSPCCHAALITIWNENVAVFHWRCLECDMYYSWNGHTLFPCESSIHVAILELERNKVKYAAEINPELVARASRSVRHVRGRC